jgi:hypothetical protein
MLLVIILNQLFDQKFKNTLDSAITKQADLELEAVQRGHLSD